MQNVSLQIAWFQISAAAGNGDVKILSACREKYNMDTQECFALLAN
jgi:hypothetical protein